MEYHCNYCHCPKELWSRTLTTYSGDECELFDSFLSLIQDKMNSSELTKVATEELPKEFADIVDIGATVKELVQIVIDCGVLVGESRDVVVASPISSSEGALRR